MTRFLILGAGRQGAACAAFLLERFADCEVVFADASAGAIDAARAAQAHAGRTSGEACDLRAGLGRAEALIAQADCAVSCVPFFFNEALSRAAIAAGRPLCDLGGNVDTVRRQIALAGEARRAGVTIVPDCGLAPGALNVLGEWWRDRWSYRAVKLVCGGLPRDPGGGVLKYQVLFSVHGLLNEYLEDCQVSRGGRLVTVPGLSEVETVEGLPGAGGPLEAFATSGGASLAAEVYAPLGVDYEYKTLRHPGHRDAVAAMREAGLLSRRPVRLADGREVAPWDVAVAAMEAALRGDRRDRVIARALVRGEADGRAVAGTVDLCDEADGRFTAMERTTGFSTAVVAAYLAGRYRDRPPPGAFAPFQVLSPRLLAGELGRAGIRVVAAE